MTQFQPPYLYIEICDAGLVNLAFVFRTLEEERNPSLVIARDVASSVKILNRYNGPINGVLVYFDEDAPAYGNPADVLREISSRKYKKETIAQIKQVFEAANINF